MHWGWPSTCPIVVRDSTFGIRPSILTWPSNSRQAPAGRQIIARGASLPLLGLDVSCKSLLSLETQLLKDGEVDHGRSLAAVLRTIPNRSHDACCVDSGVGRFDSGRTLSPARRGAVRTG